MAFENSINRYSMPVTRSRNGLYETGLDATNTARFLFGDEDAGAAQHANAIDQGFPTLVRRDDQIVSNIHFIVSLLPVIQKSTTDGLSGAFQAKTRWKTPFIEERRRVNGGVNHLLLTLASPYLLTHHLI
jgi:hypothetical protein